MGVVFCTQQCRSAVKFRYGVRLSAVEVLDGESSVPLFILALDKGTAGVSYLYLGNPVNLSTIKSGKINEQCGPRDRKIPFGIKRRLKSTGFWGWGCAMQRMSV